MNRLDLVRICIFFFGWTNLEFYFLRFYLFILRDTQRETETQAEGEVGSLREAGCGTQSQDPGITTWAEGRCSTTEPLRSPWHLPLEPYWEDLGLWGQKVWVQVLVLSRSYANLSKSQSPGSHLLDCKIGSIIPTTQVCRRAIWLFVMFVLLMEKEFPKN